MSALLARGLPTTMHGTFGMSKLVGKHKETMRKNVTKLIDYWSFSDKFYSLDSPSDGLVLLRQICCRKKHPLVLQRRRAHLLVESTQVVDIADDNVCTLKVTGHVRGPALDVNGLVHIPGVGDFHLSRIESANDPHGQPTTLDTTMIVAVSDPNRWAELKAEVDLDPMDGEQTWPTEQELKEADRRVKRVPKGMSEYQASWIVDSDGEEDDEEMHCGQEMHSEHEEEVHSGQEMHSEHEEEVHSGQEMHSEHEEEVHSGQESRDGHDAMDAMSTTSIVLDNESDKEVNMDDLDRFRRAKQDRLYPDEIDTPLNVAARVRFQKYRGLKSFRTSLWDPRENLPSDYGRIFQFADFKRSRKRVLNEIDHVEHGAYITAYIDKVPGDFIESMDDRSPLVIFALLRHEQRMSVVNLLIRKHWSCTQPVRSKDRLIFYVGYRRFEAEPVFSQHTNGDKHKVSLEVYLIGH